MFKLLLLLALFNCGDKPGSNSGSEPVVSRGEGATVPSGTGSVGPVAAPTGTEGNPVTGPEPVLLPVPPIVDLSNVEETEQPLVTLQEVEWQDISIITGPHAGGLVPVKQSQDIISDVANINNEIKSNDFFFRIDCLAKGTRSDNNKSYDVILWGHKVYVDNELIFNNLDNDPIVDRGYQIFNIWYSTYSQLIVQYKGKANYKILSQPFVAYSDNTKKELINTIYTVGNNDSLHDLKLSMDDRMVSIGEAETKEWDDALTFMGIDPFPAKDLLQVWKDKIGEVQYTHFKYYLPSDMLDRNSWKQLVISTSDNVNEHVKGRLGQVSEFHCLKVRIDGKVAFNNLDQEERDPTLEGKDKYHYSNGVFDRVYLKPGARFAVESKVLIVFNKPYDQPDAQPVSSTDYLASYKKYNGKDLLDKKMAIEIGSHREEFYSSDIKSQQEALHSDDN